MLVFFVGFVLGILRILLLVPVVGERYAELIETPLMLITIYYSARYIVNGYSKIERASSYLYVGVIALTFLLLFEFTLVLGIRGISFEQYISSRDPVTGAAYALSLIIYLLMPFIITKKPRNTDAEQ